MYMRLCRAGWLFPLVLIASCGTISPASTITSAPSPQFEQHICTIRNVDATLASRMRCGTVRVPRDYARPEGPSFALSVVVIRSEQRSALPDPVVYINGGPGEPITVYAAAQAKRPYAFGRGLVLIDQRGTGDSEPRICPTMDRELLDVTLLLGMEGGVSAEDARRAAFNACRREALSRGIVIMWAKNGAREPLASVAAKLYEAALTRQVATNAAVECRDRPHFRDATPPSDDIFARTELSGLCDTWAPLGPPLLIPAASTVPTLILAGAIDPVAEPHESRRIGEIIGGKAQWIEFPEVGHNVRAFSPCAARITADFIAQPEGRLDVSCALHPLPLQFVKTSPQQ
jgi:pimeloyl-ACP methyl ester carboxylesterase